MTRGSSPELIGRGAELQRLREAAQIVREAERCVVLISGEAGIGKSRLIEAFGQSLLDDPPSDRPVAFLASGCVDVGGSLAYLPIMELLDGARRLGPAVEAEAAVVKAALGGTVTVGATVDADAAVGRAATFLRIRELLATAAEDRNVIAVIDDLHWADRSTLDVIAFLARRLVGLGVLLVFAYRSDELHRRHPMRPLLADLARHAILDHLRLEPLDPAGVRAQITSILGEEPEPGRLKRVARLSDGNPFHVEELLSLDDDRRLPPSLREVLDARLDRLDDAGRIVVRQAAVVGREFDPVLLAAASPDRRGEVIGGLRQAIDGRILTRLPGLSVATEPEHACLT